MLVLTRKHQEQIRIGNQVTITIVKIKGNTVRIGIDAPRDVRVVRGELPSASEFQLPDGNDGTDYSAADDHVDDAVATDRHTARSADPDWSLSRFVRNRRGHRPVLAAG